jgi:double-stranded uracil-DNA glycosylase
VSDRPRRPSKDDLEAARGKRVPDVIAGDLEVLLCGINPGLYSGAVGHHFARPGNRLWKALHGSGFTDRLLSPYEERALLLRGIGITNLVARATASAHELTDEELRAGAGALEAKVERFRPRCVAVLGVSAYRTGFGEPRAGVGRRPRPIGGALTWVLPNPSGLNAHYQLPELVAAFAKLRRALDAHVSGL